MDATSCRKQITNHGWKRAVLLAVGYMLGVAFAQGAAAPHHIDAVARPDFQHVRLTLSGGLDGDYQEYYDLFPLETSSDLHQWAATTLVLRANSGPDPCQSLQPCSDPVQFFRTPTSAFPTAFPKPSGPFQVGTVSRLFASETRDSTEMGPNREFMVSIFYPATPAGWRTPQFVFEPIYEPILFDDQFVTVPRPPEVIISLLSHALPDLPVLADANLFPVLVYCHGGTYFRRDNIHKLSELASHGYVVIAADYYDATYSYLPDGTLVIGPGGFIPGGEDSSVADTQFLLDELERMNLSDPMFAGRFDLNRIGVIGWSIGGGVAGDVCRLDPRVKAAVLYDAAFYIAPGLSQYGLDKPFLCINATTELEPGWSDPAVAMYNQAARDAMFFQVDGTYHYEFSDIILMDNPSATELQRTTLVVDYTRAFFNHYLLGTAEPLLDAPSASGAVIVNWKKK